jgi:predicted secreted Zn-dependent protease
MRVFASLVLALPLALAAAWPVHAASVAKTYSYFGIGGTTLDELQSELSRRGPHVKSTGLRHPGATQMQFTTKLGYAGGGQTCRIAQASVIVDAKIILPRWRRRGGADSNVRLIWDTLSADIKRHEESHVSIAKNHARELEQVLLSLPPRANCEHVAADAKAKTADLLRKHDAAQVRFDRIENINFERRLLRLMRYRMQRIESGQIAE